MQPDRNENSFIAGISRGDQAVFKRLYEIYYRRLYWYARSYVEDPIAAEDIVQELFFALWEKREELTITSSLSSYLFRSIHNKCIQFLRHRKIVAVYEENHQMKMKEAETLLESANDYTFSEIRLGEIEQIIANVFSTLPERTRTIFSLSRDHANSHKEIADKFAISIKTVEYHITRTLQMLRHALKDYF